MRRFSDISKISRPVMRALLAGVVALAAVVLQPAIGSAKSRISPGEAAVFGVVGGLALGAILGNSGRGGGSGYVGQHHGYGDEDFGYQSYQPRQRYYQPRPVYYAPPPAYYAPQPYPACYQVQERVWVRGWGWQLHRRTVCE